MKTFEEYRIAARRTRDNAQSRAWSDRVKHWTIGLTGEAGEVANVVKKHVCTGKRSLSETRALVLDEGGDNLWYLDALFDEYDITLDEASEFNIDKLAKRHGVVAA